MAQRPTNSDLLRRLPLFIGMPCLFIGVAEWIATGDVTGRIFAGVGGALLILAVALGALRK